MATYDVTYQREEYKDALGRWALVDDCCEGQEAVKDKTTEYLPKPNPLDTSSEANQRYKDYVERAVFYNATGRTLQGLSGMVFRKWPVADLPGGLKYLETDADGAGVSIYQESQQTLEEVLKKGRCGLLTDYPRTDGAVSKAQMQQAQLRASILVYDAKNIINWRTQKIGGVHKLVLVVLREIHETPTDDGFGLETEEQYRVLRLVPGGYSQEIWRKTSKNNRDTWEIVEGPWFPTDSSGSNWDVIPFTFVGAQNNDSTIDDAPLYDLAELNIAHYRNSAEYEDTCFMCGQVQPTMTGLTEHWVKEVLDKREVKIGSRTILPLPEGASFEYVQAEPNVLPSEAMKHKEEQMIALGAQLVIQGGQARTATEANSDTAMNTSVLAMAASNVSEAYTQCLEWCARFMGEANGGTFELNQEFIEQKLDAQTLKVYLEMVQFGKMPNADFWEILRKHGVINPEKDNEKIKDELEAQEPEPGLTDGDQ